MTEITFQKELEGISREFSLDKKAQTRDENGFRDLINKSMQEVNQLQSNADEKVQELFTGGGANLHQTMIELEKADVSFRLLMQVRNKIISAYEQIMRMSI